MEVMTRINATVLNKGYIVGINNIPINMNGENYNIQVFAKL
jgi:hypothetical protein